MMVLDTNLLARALLDDDPKQTSLSRKVLSGKGPLMVLDTVLLELVWLLSSKGVPGQEIAGALEDVLALPSVTVQNPEMITRVLAWYRTGMDFGDALHLAYAEQARCDALATFDKGFIKKAKGRASCKVVSVPA